MPELNKLKNSVRFPTSIIVRGEDLLGIELAKSLLEQGGFVILIDNGIEAVHNYMPLIDGYEQNLLVLDFSGLVTLTKELRRLDYVFYLDHQIADFSMKISTQEFLQASNYLDAVLDLTAKFDAKFLLTTAIKAHQMIIADKVIDLNYNVDAEARYAVYSELEIQRYAESLVKEYQDKVGVNARVIRLGTLLGKGMEINLESGLIKMIIEALSGKNITVAGDGLETDYYIHYLDAAYGIIKAQFSPNTKGKIFTLANEEEVTVLSLAYKLLEIIPTAKEIRFDMENNALPPIKLYKPAPNLLSIGWKPRITLERALKQTIDYLKARIAEVGGDLNGLNRELIPINPVKAKEEKNFKQKLLDFFFIAETGETPSQAELNSRAEQTAGVNTEGALARLIAERKQQERARRGNIILANNQLRSSIQPKPEQNLLQKFDAAMARSLWQFRRRFDFFRNMTVLDFIFFLLGIALLIACYFVIVVPALGFAKDIYLAYRDLGTLETALNIGDYNTLRTTGAEVKGYLSEAQQRVQDLEFLFSLTGKQKTYQTWQQFLANSTQFFSNLDNVYADLEPWQQYLQDFKPGFIQRLDGTTYLSLDGSASYAADISKIFDQRSDLAISLTALDKLVPDLKSGLDTLPFQSGAAVQPYFASLQNGLSGLNELKPVYNYAPVLFGHDSPRHYLVIVQDNARYTAGGGELVGYLLFTVTDGNVSNVKVQNFAKYAANSASFDALALAELKISSTNSITSANAHVSDAALIPDRNIMLGNLQTFVANVEQTGIDMTLSINLNTLAALVGTDGFSFQQQNFTSANLLSSLSDLLNANSTAQSRNDAILSVLSKAMELHGNDLVANGPLLNSAVSGGLAGSDIFAYSSNTTISKLIAATAASGSNDHILIGANYDQKNVLLTAKPVLTLSGTITIKADGNTLKDLTLSGTSFNSLQNLLFCGPNGSKDVKISGVSNDLVTSAFSDEVDQSCVILLPANDLKYGVSYDNLPYSTNLDGKAPYKLELISSPGIEAEYDLEFVFENGVNKISPETPGFTKQNNGFLYRGSSSGDKLFIFNSN